ncbi:MAG: hypothetical protein AAFY46_17210, partial [Planctomycetota bacterium]
MSYDGFRFDKAGASATRPNDNDPAVAGQNWAVDGNGPVVGAQWYNRVKANLEAVASHYLGALTAGDNMLLNAIQTGISNAIAAAFTAHAAADDPHSQYLTQAEGDARYSGGGGASEITDIAGLQTALDSKANVAGGTFTGSIGINDALPIFALNETDGTPGYAQAWFLVNAGHVSLQTRDDAGAFVATDWQIQRDASGATQHLLYIGGVAKFTVTASEPQFDGNRVYH